MLGYTTLGRSNSPHHVYELRMYHVNPGKMDALKARFGDHTDGIFKRHNMKSIGYWQPEDAPSSENLFVYILEHPGRQEAEKNWTAFQADPEWQKVKAESEAPGALVDHIDRVFHGPNQLFSPALVEKFHDFLERIPIARGDWHTQELLDLAEVADRFHLATIQTQNESVLDGDDLQQPVIVRGQIKRKRKRKTQRFGGDADEVGYARAGRLLGEWILRCELDDVACRTNHDLAFEWQLPSERSPEGRLAHVFAHNKRSDRANVNGIEPGQLLRDRRRLTSVCPTDIHRPKKYNRRHRKKVGIRK
jgi:hypothetical protein